MRNRTESRHKIGSLVGVNAHRVTQWLSGQRVMLPETAFELGQRLRCDFGWSTSGLEFLWACAHWPEIIAILKHLSTESDANGPELVAMLYSWLPMRMFDFEVDDILKGFKEEHDPLQPLHDEVETPSDEFILIPKDGDSPFMFSSRLGVPWETGNDGFQATSKLLKRLAEVMRLDPGGQEVGRYLRNRSYERLDQDGERAMTCTELDLECSSPSFLAAIVRAWERYNNGDITYSREIHAAHSDSSAAIASAEMALVDTMIGAARKFKAVFPSYAIPRIWRMLAGWVYEIEPKATGTWSVALPDNFVNVPDVYIRGIKEAQEWDKVEDEATLKIEIPW